MKNINIDKLASVRCILVAAAIVSFAPADRLAFGQGDWRSEWEQVLAAGRKEGKVVLNVPPSAELRQALEAAFKPKFGIELEMVLSQGSAAARRVAEEHRAGVRYFDVITGSFDSTADSLIPLGALDAMESSWIFPEVKDPKRWWGGHLWGDKTARLVYYPTAFMVDNLWHNTDLVRSEEIRSYDDLLNPKWKGKLGMFDPLSGGAGLAICSYLWMLKGEAFLRQLVKQQPLLGDRRVVADSLAKGKIAITLGATYYTFLPFIKAGLPVKPLPRFKEGTYATAGNGGPVIIKNRPHPNATKVFINWFLSKEGQELYDKAFGNATRRLDVDTTWLSQYGVHAAKDSMTLDEYMKVELSSEDKIRKVRNPVQELMRQILP